MGVERFFSSLIHNFDNSFITHFQKAITAKQIYIDFNSIIHITSFSIISELNYALYYLIKGETTQKVTNILTKYKLSSSLDEFKKQLTTERIDAIIIETVVRYFINIVTKYVDPEIIELIFIGVDGVPSMSKIMEQQKRRYMGAVVTEVKKSLLEKYKDNMSPVRYEFEKNKIHWSKNNISPGTEFMHRLNEALGSINLTGILNKMCPKLKRYVFSGVYEPGEGEKKIVDYIKNQPDNTVNNIVIYSPDSDITLLSLLLNINLNHVSFPTKKVTNINVLRHDQQRNDYDIINIDKFGDSVFNYIKTKVNNMTVTRDSVLADIVFMLTIFGNDFLPKIESFSVRQDLNRLIDLYTTLISTHRRYIIYYDAKSDKNSIDKQMFINMFQVLKQDEGANLQMVYMANHYRNYDKMKTVFGEQFLRNLSEFLTQLRDFNSAITAGENDVNDDPVFINLLKQLTGNSEMTPDEFIKRYVENYKTTGTFMDVNVRFKPFTSNFNDHHKTTLEKSLKGLDSQLQITPFDIEVYKFENMLEPYFNSDENMLDLGKLFVSKQYVLKTVPIKDSVDQYYKEFFNVKPGDVDGLNEVSRQYIIGLIWVFDYYFNNFDPIYNRNFADLWFYRWSHAPLITQIYNYLKHSKESMKQYRQELLDKKVKRDEFFDTVSHLVYVTPITAQELMPPEYEAFLKKTGFNSDDLGDIRNIDCKGAIYLNKCRFIKMINTDVKKFIKNIKQIKLDKSKHRQGPKFSPNYTNVFSQELFPVGNISHK